MNFILDRLKEKSTYKGLIAVAASLGLVLSPEMQVAVEVLFVSLASAIPAVITFVASAYGVYNVLKNERR